MCRLMDLNTNVFLAGLSAFLLKKFLFNLQSPFIDFYFEDKPITFPQIKRMAVFVWGAYSIYWATKNIISQEYLFDLSLEY